MRERAVRKLENQPGASFAVKIFGITQKGNIKIYDISYPSQLGGPVPAYLVVPPGKGPFAAVLYGHSAIPNSPVHNRLQFLEEATALAHAKAVSLLIDAPFARPGAIPDEEIAELISKHFDLRPGAIIQQLDLRRPIYQQLAAYGHFGRDDLNLTWERTDKAEALKAAAAAKLQPAD